MRTRFPPPDCDHRGSGGVVAHGVGNVLKTSGRIRHHEKVFCVLLLAAATVALAPGHASAQPDPTGTAAWRSGGSHVPDHNEWNGASFGSTLPTVDVGKWRIVTGAEAPWRDEIILLGVDTDKEIDGMMWNGSAWSAFPFNPLDEVSDSFWWGCAVAYEQQSGDALIVWNNNSGDIQELSYRVWNGIAWSNKLSITHPVAGEPEHMRLAADPNSDAMVLVVSNDNSQDYALVWDGSSWGNSQVLDSSGAGDDRTDIYVAYEQQSGRALVTYGKGAENVYYRIWDGLAWSGEDSLAAPANLDGNTRWTTLDSDPNSNRIALGVVTFSNDIWLTMWDGTSWETPYAPTKFAPGSTFPAVAVAFEGQSGEALATHGYENWNYIYYCTWNSTGGWTSRGTGPLLDAEPNSMTLDSAPRSNHIMLSVQDHDKDLSYVLWDGTSWGAIDELETNTEEDKNQPFIFVWDQIHADISLIKSVDMPTANEGNTVTYTITVTNTGPDDATGVMVTDLLPVGVTYMDDWPTRGSYDSGTGAWSVGTLVNGASATLRIAVSINTGTAGSIITNTASVTAVEQEDHDNSNDTDTVDVMVNTAAVQMAMATSTYLGTGSDNLVITGLGFQPDVVIVKADDNYPAYMRTATLPNELSLSLVDQEFPAPKRIMVFTSDGFTVGNDPGVNSAGIIYHFMAFRAAPGEMDVGYYKGNGFDNHNVTGLGFDPDYVIVSSEDFTFPYQRSSVTSDGFCMSFRSDGTFSNHIQRMIPDGFQVGSDWTVNQAGWRHHYVAWKAVPGQCAVDEYWGDGSDFRDIPGAGFEPEYVIVKTSGDQYGVHRPQSLGPGDTTLYFGWGGTFEDGIQALQPDGFQVGRNARVNEPFYHYYWMAFRNREPWADLQISKIVDDPNPDEGASVTYTVTVRNNGPNHATGVRILDLLPSGITYVSDNPSQGSYDSGTGVWTVSNLDSGISATLDITATVDAGTGGSTITNTASVLLFDGPAAHIGELAAAPVQLEGAHREGPRAIRGEPRFAQLPG